MNARVYWAISHYYGAYMRDERGRMLGIIHAFATKAERDGWVGEGNPYVDQCDAREALPAAHREVRKAIADCRMYYRPTQFCGHKEFRDHERKRALLAMFARQTPPAEMWAGNV